MNSEILRNEVSVNRLYSAFRYEFPEEFSNKGEKHNSWEFVYVESGRISVKADQKKYVVKSGEMICHKPMEFHALAPYHSRATAIIFCFECAGEKMKYFENKIINVNHKQRFYLNELVATAEKFFVKKEPDLISKDGFMERSRDSSDIDAQYLKNTIESLIISLYSSDSTEKSSRANLYSQHLKRKSLTEGIKDYITNNIGTKITLEKIAAQFSYSVSTVKTVFKEETGMGIISFYNKTRLEVAKNMLIEKHYSISEISDKLNFNSPSHFSNFFKNALGVSPKDFAK